ncbi:hypothetical protein N7527_005042 [Penicillium freii]|nr:hypothetical protein N7527_005042 [Penicillium freii]
MPWRRLVHTRNEVPPSEFGFGRTLPAGFTQPSSGVDTERSIWTTTSPRAAYDDPRGEYTAFISTVKGDTTEKGLSREAPFRILVATSEGDLGIPDGKYTTVSYVEFVQLYEPSLEWLPIGNFQKRTTWMVGIVSNLRNTTKPNSVNVGQWATHWGVYILPKTPTTDEYPYKIYGLNFSAASEFTRVTEPVEMHFAHDEFILTARFLLMKFHEKQDGYRHIKQIDAKAYSLVAKNCHTFAEQILQHMIAEKWTNPYRLEDEDVPTWPGRLKHDVIARYADRGLMEGLKNQPVKQRKKLLTNVMKKEGLVLL